MTTTTISINSEAPPHTSKNPTILPHSEPFAHALIIDVDDSKSGSLSPSPTLAPLGINVDESKSFLERLRAFVRTDGKLHDAIDMVRFNGTSGGMPSEDVWKALDGLKPKHLDVGCGWDEDCDMIPLDVLQQKWDLETLTLRGLAGAATEFPSVFCGLKALTMKLCCNVDFKPIQGQLNALHHLTITGNDSLDMFAFLCESNPSVGDHLQTLDLQCDPRLDNYEPELFKKSLARCTALLRLRLVLGGPESIDQYLGIVHILPSSLEHLTYRGMPEMSSDLPEWVKSAADPTWLPHLKTISFAFDVAPDADEDAYTENDAYIDDDADTDDDANTGDDAGTDNGADTDNDTDIDDADIDDTAADTPSLPDAEQMMRISTQVTEFLDTLSSHRPNIQVLENC